MQTVEQARAEGAVSSNQQSEIGNHQFFYTGKPYLEETGQYLFLFRHYDPELARWTTADPSGFPDGANNVVYSNSPLTRLDPTGLELLLTEQEAIGILSAQITSWNNQGWTFAGNLLSHFVANTGGQYTGSSSEASLIREAQKYRNAAQSHFNSIAGGYLGQGDGVYNIGTAWNGQDHANKAFGARWKPADDGHLFNALGGAHFFYTGTLTVASGRWTVDVTMEQADWYTFMTPEGYAAAVLNAPPSGRAAWFLEKHYGYVPFWNYEAWTDRFVE